MPNTLLTPSIVAREALMRLENNLVMGGLVYRDYSGEFQRVGDTISVRKPATFEAQEYNGSTITIQNATEVSVPVKMDHWFDVSFRLTAKDRTLSLNDFSEQFVQPAVAAIAQKVDATLAGCAADIPYSVDVSGTPAVDDIIALGTKLNQMKAPLDQRRLVLDPATQGKYLALAAFRDASQSGNSQTVREANLGRVFGLDVWMDQNVPSLTKGDLATNATLTGTSGGLTGTIASGGNAKSIKAGDLFTIADTAGQYVCTKLLTTAADGTGTLEFYPALPAGVSGKAITVHASHAANLAFHRNAFALVTRPLEAPAGAKSEVINYNGLSIRAVYSYDMNLKADVVSLDLLCGVKTLTPELAVRLCG